TPNHLRFIRHVVNPLNPLRVCKSGRIIVMAADRSNGPSFGAAGACVEVGFDPAFFVCGAPGRASDALWRARERRPTRRRNCGFELTRFPETVHFGAFWGTVGSFG